MQEAKRITGIISKENISHLIIRVLKHTGIRAEVTIVMLYIVLIKECIQMKIQKARVFRKQNAKTRIYDCGIYGK
jgi:hypothetical protein